MKKILIASLFLFVVVGVLYYLNKRSQPPISLPMVAKETNQASPQLPRVNLVETVSNVSHATILQPTNTVEIVEPINALTATNLEQWKAAIKGLKQLGGFKFTQEWLVETPGRKVSIPITLNQGDKTVQYSAVLISVSADNGSGNIRETEMQTPNMNIDETKQLGLQLCDMLQVDPKNFLAWCNKVGNNWLDQPLFGDGNQHYSFQTLHGFNNERPWVINFMIIPNP